MDHFVLSKRSLLAVTTEDLIKRVMYFRCTDFAKGRDKSTAFNKAQKAVPFLQRIAPLSEQSALIVAADRGEADWCRILPHGLHAWQGSVRATYFAVPPRNTNLLLQACCQRVLP